jgi:hypothetical protein
LDETAEGSGSRFRPIDPGRGGTGINSDEQAFLTEMRISLTRGHAGVAEDLANDV